MPIGKSRGVVMRWAWTSVLQQSKSCGEPSDFLARAAPEGRVRAFGQITRWTPCNRGLRIMPTL